MKTLIYEYRWTIGIFLFFYAVMVVIWIYKKAKEDQEKYGGPWFKQILTEFKNSKLRTIWKYIIFPLVILD